MIVTFDLFSALTDSRTGGSRLFADLGLDGEATYDAWDRRAKLLQARQAGRDWAPSHEISLWALEDVYSDARLRRDARADLAALEDSVPDWPLWPDVADAVAQVAALEGVRVGILSNVDDGLCRRTRAFRLVDPDLALTSQRLGAYKPAPLIYERARSHAQDQGHELVHVAASARDVRGALEAGLRTVRLARQGHHRDPDGPAPEHEVEDARDLADLVRPWAAPSPPT